jgi:hypothetical protein
MGEAGDSDITTGEETIRVVSHDPAALKYSTT